MKIYLENNNTAKSVDSEEIDVITSQGNYFQVWHGGQRFTMLGSLNSLNKSLPGFFRANRKTLFNTKYLSHIDSDGVDSIIILNNGKQIPISRRELVKLKQMLKSMSINF